MQPIQNYKIFHYLNDTVSEDLLSDDLRLGVADIDTKYSMLSILLGSQDQSKRLC